MKNWLKDLEGKTAFFITSQKKKGKNLCPFKNVHLHSLKEFS